MSVDGKLRLFYAFELSDEVRATAVDAQAKLKYTLGDKHARWTDPADMHITSLFIGDVANVRLHTLVEAGVDAAAQAGPFELTTGGVGRFPPSGPPRVLWLGATEPADKPASRVMQALHRRLPDVRLDHKTYRPHATLAYLKPSAQSADVNKALHAVGPAPQKPLIIDRLVLMQTIPEEERRKSGGRRYNIVQAFPFVK